LIGRVLEPTTTIRRRPTGYHRGLRLAGGCLPALQRFEELFPRSGKRQRAPSPGHIAQARGVRTRALLRLGFPPDVEDGGLPRAGLPSTGSQGEPRGAIAPGRPAAARSATPLFTFAAAAPPRRR